MKYSAKYTKNNGTIYLSRDYMKLTEDRNKVRFRIPPKLLNIMNGSSTFSTETYIKIYIMPPNLCH